MYLDIAICLYILLLAFLGWRAGFIHEAFGFLAAVVSLVVALLTAKPLAGLMDKWFGLSGHLSNWINGQGEFINILICGIVVFIILRVIFFFLSKLAVRIKEKNKVVKRIDKIAGIFLGIGKALFYVGVVCVSLYFLSAIPFMQTAIDWVFNGSYVGKFIYDVTIDFVVPLLGIKAFNGGGILDEIFK